MSSSISLIAELEDALKGGSSEKRVETLRRVTDLFLNDADRLNEQQIRVFDDVLVHLIQRINTKALVQLSTSLAPIDNAPIEVIQRLAHYEEITVAGPVLAQSNRLTEDDLIEIAEIRSQGHLLAISGRASLNEALTDVLVRRGHRQVTHKLAQKSGARFSETGFAKLVKNAETDESLAEKLGLRLDIPLQLRRELLLRATDAVRSHLLASAPPEAQDQIRRTLASIANEVDREATGASDFVIAAHLVQEINRNGNLNESIVREFASAHRYEEVVVALSLMCYAPIQQIESLMKNVRLDGLVVACKAAGLEWPTASMILKNRFAHHSVPDDDLAQAKSSFLLLSQTTAQRTLRFGRTRDVARKAC